MFRSIRNAFFTGIIAIFPLGVTLFVVGFLLDKLGTPASSFFFQNVDPSLKESDLLVFLMEAVSVFAVFALITLLGYFSRFFLGRMMLNAFEQLLHNVPFINTVYGTVKQIVTTFSEQKKAVFQEVVLIEYPRKKCYVIGFLTSKAKGETQAATGEKIVNIFVPTTPNPTSGFLLMLPENDITRLKMSVADGMKVIISGGAVVPPEQDQPVTVTNPKEVTGSAL